MHHFCFGEDKIVLPMSHCYLTTCACIYIWYKFICVRFSKLSYFVLLRIKWDGNGRHVSWHILSAPKSFYGLFLVVADCLVFSKVWWIVHSNHHCSSYILQFLYIQGCAHCKILHKYCIFWCRTHFSHIAASPYAKWQHRLNKLCLTGGCCVTQQ